MKADESEMTVRAKGVDPLDGSVLDLYSITVNRSMRMNTWLMLVAGIFVAIVVLSCCIIFCLHRRQRQIDKQRRNGGIEMLPS